ncbi:hypothetical protein MY5147_005572 [Beauveria neobassiana]
MVIKYSGVGIPASFASCSITSKRGESLLQRMKSIKSAGFDGMEMSMPDIVEFAQTAVHKDASEKDIDVLIEASKQIKNAAEAIGLKIMMLQPFPRFEGWDAPRREAAFAKAKDWLRIMEALGTDTLQVGSSDAEDISRDRNVLAKDLGDLAQLCSSKRCRVAYENWCWSTHAPTWKAVWEIVEKANHPNLGLCLDTFQAAGAEYADPTTHSGYVESVDKEDTALETSWHRSLHELATTVPADKIFVLQISDAYKVTPPLGRDKGKAEWSRRHRPLPCNGGYLPVQEVLNAVLATGFRGWLSVEVFDPNEEKKMANDDYTTAAMLALKKLVAMAR